MDYQLHMLRHSENAESKVFYIAPVVKRRQSFITIDMTVLWMHAMMKMHAILSDAGIIHTGRREFLGMNLITWKLFSNIPNVCNRNHGERVRTVRTDSVSLCIHIERGARIPFNMT
eukprot:751942-Hanusia_phi.AAC.3